MRRFAYLTLSAIALAGLGACGGCDDEGSRFCTYHGEDYSPGATWNADDGCNKCSCGEDFVIHCANLNCDPEDAGPGVDAGPDEDGGGGIDAGVGDVGPTTNEVVPYPATTCAIATVNGGAPSGELRPGDIVTLTVPSVTPPTPGAALTSTSWSLARAPRGSHVFISGQGVLTPDVIGTYAPRATLGFDSGDAVVADCALHVRPPDSLYVELTWDRDGTDLDIQLMKQDPQDRYCAILGSGGGGTGPDDLAVDCGQQSTDFTCYFANCKGTFGDRPDWDGDGSGQSAGDPLLTFDALYGYGPESILIEDATPSSLLAGVYFWSDHGLGITVNATLRVFAYGQLRAEYSQELQNEGWWEAALIDWPAAGGDLCVGDPAGVDQGCFAAPQCDPAPLCAQCTDASSCGPGSTCDQALSLCIAGSAPCLNDSMCGSGLACIPATDACSEPTCTVDTDCEEAREICAPDTRACVLPPAQCTETNEPNNDTSSATPIVAGAHSDILCRGDVDYLALSAQADKRLFVTVTFTQPDVSGVRAELLDASGAYLDGLTAYGSEPLVIETRTGAAADYYVALLGDGTLLDQWDYSVSVEELDPLACEGETGEPNDTQLEASNSILGLGTHDRTLCGFEDQDFHQITATADMRTVFTATFLDSEGNVELELFDVGGQVLGSSFGVGDVESISYTAGASDEIVHLSVWRFPGGGGLEAQDYQLTISQQAPLSCDDGHEPNESTGAASPVAPGSLDAVICDDQDHDFYSVEIVGSADLTATLTFVDAEGDLDLAIWDDRGNEIGFSGTSNSTEQASVAGLVTGTYYVEVRPYALGSPPPDRQPYSLDIALTGLGDAGVPDAATEDAGAEDAGVEDAANEDAAGGDLS